MNKLAVMAATVLAAAGTVSAQSQYAYDPAAESFASSDQLSVQRVTFRNQYQLDVVGNLFMPKGIDLDQRYAAIVVGHPMGAVKEQSANLYAVHLAERGFVTLSIDLSFWGESTGEPRNAVSPDIYAEDFSAAVDYLGTRPYVDRERIGAIGICGSGSFVISAAKIDPRIKAIATVSMYDMGQASRHALNKSLTPEQRRQIIADAAERRYTEFEGAPIGYTGGSVHELTENSMPVEGEFYAFYRNPMALMTVVLGVLAGIAGNNGQWLISDAASKAPDFANGLFLASTNLGTTLGTSLCGLFITTMGTRYSVVGAVIFLLLAVVFIVLRGRAKKEEVTPIG